MKYGEVKKLVSKVTHEDIAKALNNLSLGKASEKEQLIAHHFYQEKISTLSDELAELCQRRKNLAKEWDKWCRMQMVYKLIHDPTMGGLVSDIEPFSHNKAYIETPEYVNEYRRKDNEPHPTRCYQKSL